MLLEYFRNNLISSDYAIVRSCVVWCFEDGDLEPDPYGLYSAGVSDWASGGMGAIYIAFCSGFFANPGISQHQYVSDDAFIVCETNLWIFHSESFVLGIRLPSVLLADW